MAISLSSSSGLPTTVLPAASTSAWIVRGGIAWTDVDVVKQPSGQPTVALTGESAAVAARLGIVRWHLSISHIETHATASAIGLRGE